MNYLSWRRRKYGLTQKNAAQILGVELRTVKLWEHKSWANVSTRARERLANLFVLLKLEKNDRE